MEFLLNIIITGLIYDMIKHIVHKIFANRQFD